MSETRSYPRHAKTDAGDIEFRYRWQTYGLPEAVQR